MINNAQRGDLMIDSKILVSVVIVLVIGVAAAGYQISNTPGLWQPVASNSQDSNQQSSSSTETSSGNQQSSGSASGASTSYSQKSSGTESDNVKISYSEAKTIAQQSIEEDGATAGTPKLITSGGKQVYLVPVVLNGNQVGSIYVDAQTGENLGGEGGAP